MSTGNTNNSSSLLRSSTSTTTTQACAACKYQRRKCNPDCALAPYFPADHQRQFLNAHRLFGVSNILKIIKNLDPIQRSEAMNTIIYQSNVRAHDPVGGCYHLIQELERQCEYFSAELAVVMHQLQMYRDQQHQIMMPMTQNVDDIVYGNNLMMAQQLQQQQQQCYDYFYFDGHNIENDDDMNNIHIQSNYNDNTAISSNSVNNNNDNNVGTSNGNGNEVDIESMLSLQHQYQHEDDVKPLIDVFDITNTLGMNGDEEEMGDITSKTADLDLASGSNYHCSNEIILTKKEEANPMEHAIQEHDLKGAASLFTLTSRDSSYI